MSWNSVALGLVIGIGTGALLGTILGQTGLGVSFHPRRVGGRYGPPTHRR
jgi:hypothetical protein